MPFQFTQNKLMPYINSLIIVALVTFLGWLPKSVLSPENLIMFYLFIVLIVATWLGRGPAFMTLIISVLVFDYFFLPPHMTIMELSMESIVRMAGFMIIGFMISDLASKTKQQAVEASQREAQVTMLYHLSKELAAANSFEEVLQIIRSNVGKIFNCSVAVFLLTPQKLDVISSDVGFPVTEQEKDIARWVFQHGLPAGMCTENYTDSKVQYLPLKTAQGVSGVLGIYFKEDQNACDLRENYLLSTLANQAAVAIQRTKLTEVSRQVELMHEREKLQTALLNSISHDFRTPLVSIMGVLNSLLQDYSSLDSATRQELLQAAYEDSDHLNRLVGNLLDMTRLEAKALKMHIEPCELRDVVGASLQSLKDEVERRNIIIHIPKDLPEIPMDFVLMMRVFINLVDNAVKYSAIETPIEIIALIKDEYINVNVRDYGIGIPKDDLIKIFDKFYRAVKPRQITGTGLGLSICKGIVEAHGGRIFAENNLDKGATITMILPLKHQEHMLDGK